MFKRPRSDIWRVGVVPVPFLQANSITLSSLSERIVWLPDAGSWRYLADPFGLVRDGVLHVFVEAFDYRTRKAVIERHRLCAQTMAWKDKDVVLDEPFHLSYPFVFEDAGHVYMVPESHQANEVTLYRAVDPSLSTWRRDGVLSKGLPIADTSLIHHGGYWWMFYTIVGPRKRDQRELHLAHSPSLRGPWKQLEANPIVDDLSGSRPAGRPVLDVQTGDVVLPVQDSSKSYGGAVRLLRFTELRPRGVIYRVEPETVGPERIDPTHPDGLHTLSECGPFTLLDVKRIDRSRMRQWFDLKRRVARWGRRLANWR